MGRPLRSLLAPGVYRVDTARGPLGGTPAWADRELAALRTGAAVLLG